ncbi:uncharacterized protein LAESUDRAFT_19728 [Laetiporus sulphureus 93-53]|uniref:Uncharacterized protein n=1 Tax=Laetiporus sulphureus 93-53 TaxID=1314785 RepID=A0A165IC32_9APHY|nr:uncharacterized protein LAESUDRAFT_19728 [Laetiporus sulphureus 93-53]KZT12875.1 hypothetical protein LAESUDRAFT_19728 [Laetiporus sulphureus 93-53]
MQNRPADSELRSGSRAASQKATILVRSFEAPNSASTRIGVAATLRIGRESPTLTSPNRSAPFERVHQSFMSTISWVQETGSPSLREDLHAT